MTWKQWSQLIAALLTTGFCIYVGVLILPALTALAPIIAWTAGGAIEISLVSVGVGIPAFVVISLKSLHSRSMIAEINARKLLVTEGGFIQGYVSASPKDRIIVPQITAYTHKPIARIVEEQAVNQAPLMIEAPALIMPEAPAFRSVMHHIRGEQVVIAYDHSGAVLGNVLDWLSTLLVGRPGLGKSTALYFFIAQLMMLLARFQVLDPHGTLISLKNMLPYINRTDGCIQAASAIERELEERMDRYEANDGQCLDPHFMLIVDELPAIADREMQLMKAMDRQQRGKFRSLIDVLRRVVCEGRKYKMYCMVVGQSIPASILPTVARDNMSTRYVFSCSADHARMAGLDKEAIDAYLPSLQGNKGKCIVAPARMKAFLGAIPLTDIDDLRYVIEATGYEKESGNASVFPESTVSEPETTVLETGNAETPLPDGITQEILEQIQEMVAANWPFREIAKMVHLTGRNYWKFQAAMSHLGVVRSDEGA